MKTRKTMLWLRVAVLVAAAGVIGFLALRSSPYLTELRWVPRGLAEWADSHGVVRNIPAFAVFYWLVLVGLGWRRRVIALVGVCALAACVEFAQLLLADRIFGWDDIGASWAGAVAAYGLALGVVFAARGLRRGVGTNDQGDENENE